MEKDYRIRHSISVVVSARNKDRAIEKFFGLMSYDVYTDEDWKTTVRREK